MRKCLVLIVGLVLLYSGCSGPEQASSVPDVGITGEYGSVLEEPSEVLQSGEPQAEESEEPQAEESEEPQEEKLSPGELGEVSIIPIDGDGRVIDAADGIEITPPQRVSDPTQLEGYGKIVEPEGTEPKIEERTGDTENGWISGYEKEEPVKE